MLFLTVKKPSRMDSVVSYDPDFLLLYRRQMTSTDDFPPVHSVQRRIILSSEAKQRVWS